MRPYIPAVVFGFFCVLASQTDVRADSKAEKEATCEAQCQSVAETNFKACNKIPQCEDYVRSEYAHCMHECDK